MMKKRLFFVVLILLPFYFNHLAWSQKEYSVRQLDPETEQIKLDGILDEDAWHTTTTVLERLEKYEITDTTWVSIQNLADPNDSKISWRAVWLADSIFFGIEVIDDKFDDDNYRKDNPRQKNIQNDDGFHIYFDNQKNIPPYKWKWSWPSETLADSNYLIHNFFEKYFEENEVIDSFFVQEDESFKFRAPIWTKTSGCVFDFNYAYSSDSSTWTIEAVITSGSGPLKVEDYFWAQLTYNDADDQIIDGRVVRDYRLAWNIHLPDFNIQPWTQPGKLMLTGHTTETEYQVKNIDAKSKIRIDGYDDEEDYHLSLGAVFTNAREVSGPTLNWSAWSNYNDAFIILHALSDFDSRTLYIVVKVFDDHQNLITQISRDNLINADALLLWIDYDNDPEIITENDINILIRSNGTMHKLTGFEEQYDTTKYVDSRICVKTGSFGSQLSNWVAEIALQLPDWIQIGDTLKVDIGYNDADFYKVREHQLVWSTTDSGRTPWSNFTKLGRFILTGEPLISSVHSSGMLSKVPVDFQLFPNYPNPFNTQTNIKFSLKKNCHVSIHIYDLLGRRVRTVLDKDYMAGFHQIRWDGRDENNKPVASGIYFVMMKAEGFKTTNKIALVK